MANNWKAYVGVVSLNDVLTSYSVERIILNENYDSNTNDQDVALLKLASQVNYNGWLHLCFIKNNAKAFIADAAHRMLL